MSNHKARCEKNPIYSSVMDQQNNKLTLILKDLFAVLLSPVLDGFE